MRVREMDEIPLKVIQSESNKKKKENYLFNQRVYNHKSTGRNGTFSGISQKFAVKSRVSKSWPSDTERKHLLFTLGDGSKSQANIYLQLFTCFSHSANNKMIVYFCMPTCGMWDLLLITQSSLLDLITLCEWIALSHCQKREEKHVRLWSSYTTEKTTSIFRFRFKFFLWLLAAWFFIVKFFVIFGMNFIKFPADAICF